MRIVFFVVVALLLGIHGEVAHRDLASLTTKFQLLISELGVSADGATTYETEMATMLQRLEQFSTPKAQQNMSIEIDWFTGAFAQAIPMRMILVVSSFEGMYLNSGIGTFYAALADFLVNRGHTVTILYTHTAMSGVAAAAFKRWQANYEKRGIMVVKLPHSPIHVTAPTLTKKSYQVYQYLKEHAQEFDVVHFPDWEGPGYFSLLAKHQGLAFTSVVFIVGLHGPWRWVKHGNLQPVLAQVEDVETDWLERRSLELADIVITPSADLPRWLIEHGWGLSQNRQAEGKLYLMPFLPGKEVAMVNQKSTGEADNRVKVSEIVFFGRMEVRKGVVLFADALDDLASTAPELSKNLKVSFLGRGSTVGSDQSTAYLDQRAQSANWPFKLNYITHKDRKGALEYVRQSGRLVVIPSLVDNAPYTLYECLYTRTPFIASDLPSIAALVRPEDRMDVLFTATSVALSLKLKSALSEGAVVARGVLSAEDSINSWASFYGMVSTLSQAHAQSDKAELHQGSHELPMVSVCITHFNRPQFLSIAIQSVLHQDYPLAKVEIVVVDDGSTNADAVMYIEKLKGDFENHDWQVLRTENKYLGAARNTAARAARGEYILFLDDDNLAKPKQISTYVTVAHATGADVLTAAHDVFRGTGLPDGSANTNLISRSVPLGPAVSVGIFKNCFGDANFFMKRSAFIASGGFTEEKGVGQEDHEYLAKVVLSGLNLEAIPEPLLYYRMHNKSEQMIYTTNPVENQIRSTRPYASILDPDDPDANSLLKVLAKRSLRGLARGISAVEDACNMTIQDVYPSEFPTLSKVSLSFSVTSPDCDITYVLIGSYQCTNINVTSSTEFICTTPPILIPATYALTVELFDGRLLQDKTVRIRPATTTGSSAMIALQFVVDDTIYTQENLFNELAALADIDSQSFVPISDDVLSGKREVLAFSTRHDMRVAIISNTHPAADVVQGLKTDIPLNKPRFEKIGVIFLDIDVMATCDSTGDCSCGEEFNPPYCDTKVACFNNCSSKGECIDGTDNTKVCECWDGYTGSDCSSETCPNECSGRGACLLQYGSAPVCQCDEGWFGDACNVSTSGCPNNCTSSSNGVCNAGVCSCKSGYSGSDCSVLVCPNACSGHGLCSTRAGSSPQCQCDDGFSGSDCSVVYCSNSCYGHGTCVLRAGAAPVCQCDQGWQGDLCNSSVPCPADCNGRGTCILGMCSCQTGYSGVDCSGTESNVVQDNSNQTNMDDTVLGVVIAVVGVIFLVAIGLVIYVIRERRRG